MLFACRFRLASGDLCRCTAAPSSCSPVHQGFLRFAVLPAALFVGGLLQHAADHEFPPGDRGEVYPRPSLPPATLSRSKNNMASRPSSTCAATTRVATGMTTVAQARQLDINHIDFKMSQQGTSSQAEQLVAIMRDAPKPLLIRCQAGADRTGLASTAIWQRSPSSTRHLRKADLHTLWPHLLPISKPTRWTARLKTRAMARLFQIMIVRR